jgi:hypothetical protein
MQNSQANESPTTTESAEKAWFDKPGNIRMLIGALIVVCIGLVLADFMYTNDHPYFAWESIFGFQAWVGFIAFVVIVFLGRLLRPIVRRRENYYD